MHYGVGWDDDPPGVGSGRYPHGSGENPNQHQFNFLAEYAKLKTQGYTQKEMAEMLLGPGKNSTNLRTEISIQRKKERQINRSKAIELYDKYHNYSKVGAIMGKNESSIRALLDPVIAERTDRYENTANMLKKLVDKKGYIDISENSNLYLDNVSSTTMKVAVELCEREGYVKGWVKIPQLGTKHETTVTVLAKQEEGETKSDVHSRIYKNRFNISPIQEFTPDSGKTWWTPEFPESMGSDRVMIRYAEDGGKAKDGVIEINPNAKDLSLESSQYAQVRIAVDGTNYMKGMAIYASEPMPPGIDVIYNTNKHKGVPAIDKNATYNPETGQWSGKEVLKRMKIDGRTGEVDRENPFGATIKVPKEVDGILTRGGQHYYTDEYGNRKLSPINKLQEEGDWDTWSRNLSSQFLSKQPVKLIRQQINLSIGNKKMELEEIRGLENTVVRKKLLNDFAESCDHNAAKLYVTGFKNQAFQVLLPIPDLKDNEVYAPNYEDGDVVALVRYPHGGTFEIPVLTVNNKHKTARNVMRGASDAIGINPKVAERLSGADFDGDTAAVIPLKSNRIDVISTKPLPGLVDFDPKEMYPLPDSAPRMKNKTKQNEMGRVTNLITDMTIQGATEDQIERAVRHSMVVIDAEKHHLDYKKSAKDNRIHELKKEYQGRINPETGRESTAASTIFSRASSEIQIDERKEITRTSDMTPDELKRWNDGKKVYRDTGKKIVQRIDNPDKMTPEELEVYRSGKKVYRTTEKNKQEKVYRMDIVDDATELVRDKYNLKEMAYAEYANDLKRLANEARKEARSIETYKVDVAAKAAYKDDIDDLNRQIRLAKMNSAKERRAQGMANAMVAEKREANPDMDYEHLKREQARCLNQARAIVGAKKPVITISDRQLEAIQAHAVSSQKVSEILANTDIDSFKKRVSPRNSTNSLTDTQLSMLNAMLNTGMYTQKEIADKLHVSVSLVSATIRGQRAS